MEEIEVRQWRQASARNERRYLELAEVWSATDLAAPTVPGRPPSGHELIRLAERKQSRGVPRRRVWPAWSAAAAAVLTIGIAAGRWGPWDRAGSFGAAEFTTAAWEMATVRLGDGTIVRLAPRSRLQVTGRRGEREVWLEGQAFFAVARRRGESFVVRTPVGEATVLGTRFDVRSEPERLRVVVVDGRVRLTTGAAPVEVGRGEIAEARAGGIPSVSRAADIQALLTWMTDALVFQDTPLGRVAREIERRHGVRVQLTEATLADRTVTAWFTSQNLEEVVAVVCRVTGAECTIRGKTVIISP